MGDIVIGSTAFWCPETVNDVVGVCDDLAIVTGHARTFVWAMPGGEPLAIWARRGLHDTVAIARDRDTVIVDSRAARRRLSLATGEVIAEEPAVPCARIAVDNARTKLTITAGDGAHRERASAWAHWAGMARDGGRYAVCADHRVVVYDAASDAVVYTCDRWGVPTLSADGRYLAVSLLGPPRLWLANLATGHALSSDQPHSLDTVLVGDGDRMIVDDTVWSLDGPRRIAALAGVGHARALRDDRVIGTGPVPAGSVRGMIGRWRLGDGACIGAIELPARNAWCVSVDRSGRWAACTLDSSRGLLLDLIEGVWLADLDAGTFARIAGAPGGAGVSIAPDGESIAVAHDRVVRVIDRSGRELRRIAAPEGVQIAIFSPDGRRLAIDGGSRDPEDGDADGDGDTIVDRDGTVHRPGPGPWLGWCGDDLVRRAGDRLERVTIDGAVAARCTIGEVRRVWLGDGRLATAAGDGCLIVRDLLWTTAT